MNMLVVTSKGSFLQLDDDRIDNKRLNETIDG